MKTTSNTKGQLAVSKAELRAFELGYIPSRPLCDTRYDLIIDDSKSLRRIQVKYANIQMKKNPGVVHAKLEYEDRHKKSRTYQKDEVDGLIVYIPKIDKLCYFPNEIFLGKKKLSIRLEKTRNNYAKGVRYAKDYFW